MIVRLQNRDIEISKNIRSVFQLSYGVEAKLLKVTDFPPLRRPLENYVNSNTVFFGYLKNEGLVGIIEIAHNNGFTDIHSLVVHPGFFKQGIASKLITFVFKKFDSSLVVVETGLQNEPAIKLYQKFNFKAVKQWNTADGIRKIKFERRQES